jgi:phosphoribosylformimino-5-aminoimidazole carboxamide ribotide isomerase
MIIPIPAIDLINGHVVRLHQGDYNQKTIYHKHPLEAALMLEQIGFKRLHLVDLDGAKAGKIQQLSVLENLAANTQLQIDFGGGIRSLNDMESILTAGALQVTVGSLALEQPALVEAFLQKHGPTRLLLAADVKNGMLVSRAWTAQSEVGLSGFLEYWAERGLHEVFVTEVSRDGAMRGPATELYADLCAAFPQLRIIASGGVRGPGDVQMLAEAGCYGAIIGKALYEDVVPRMRWIELLQKGTYVG